MRKKKRAVKITGVNTIRELKLKAIQLNAVDPSKVYIIELNECKEAFGTAALMITKIFKDQGIQTIVVPAGHLKIYKLNK